jgi:hypothetical protein
LSLAATGVIFYFLILFAYTSFHTFLCNFVLTSESPYLEKVTSENPELGDPELDSIRGIISLPKDFDLKKEARKLRIKKHG